MLHGQILVDIQIDLIYIGIYFQGWQKTYDFDAVLYSRLSKIIRIFMQTGWIEWLKWKYFAFFYFSGKFQNSRDSQKLNHAKDNLHNLQPTIFNLQPTTCSLQSTTYTLQHTAKPYNL